MNVDTLLADNAKKPKEKVETLSSWLLNGTLPAKALIYVALQARGAAKANCIEAFEFATRQEANIASEALLYLVTDALADKASRVRWESAKVIGNIAHLFPEKLDKAINNLLINAAHNSTVVRWSAAFALGEICKLASPHSITLLPAIEAICIREANAGVKKKYLEAMQQVIPTPG